MASFYYKFLDLFCSFHANRGRVFEIRASSTPRTSMGLGFHDAATSEPR
jgi:hypothetical protein